MKNSQQLANLLSQLKEMGYEVKEIEKSSIDSLKRNSEISKDTLEKLSSNQSPNFEAFVAWSKSF